MRSVAKTILLLLLYPFAYVRRLVLRRKDVVVLMYHSVENTDWKFGVRPREFVEQMKYLREYYTIVPLEDIVAYARGDIDLPNKSVAITLDDGYADTYDRVFQEIKKHQFPLTVFLTSNLRPLPQLGDFERLTKKQIEEMYKSGLVKFEVHGRNHAHLTGEGGSTFLDEEILGCLADIKEYTGYSSRCIAYPSGVRDNGITDYVKRAGFEAAFTINDGTIQPGCDLYSVKRVQVDKSMNMMQFKLRLTGAIDINKAIVKFIRKKV